MKKQVPDRDVNSCEPGLLVTSNALLGQPDALQERLRSDGYLYLRQVLNCELILGLRLDILEIFQRHGWLLAGSPLDSAVTDSVPAVEGEDAFFEVYDEIQQLESFHSFSHSQELSSIMQAAVGATAFPHPLSIARLGFPNNPECTTPPHQDYPNNQGSKELYAAWVPLGDCPRSLGGLSILEKSPALGLLPTAFSLGAGGRQAELPEAVSALRWLSADFKCGDVLIFGSLVVHRSLPNMSDKQFRLSVDYRYQEEGKALTATVLEPHFGRLDWEQVYRGWQSTHLQYYWRSKDYVEVEWDSSLHQLPEGHMAEAVRLSRNYNQRRQNWGQQGSAPADSQGQSRQKDSGDH